MSKSNNSVVFRGAAQQAKPQMSRSSTSNNRSTNNQVTYNREQNQIVHTVCGLVDPFCEHANGAKYPDDSSVKTLAFTIRQEQVFTSDIGGKLGFIVAPSYVFSSLCTATVAGNNIVATVLPAAVVAPLVGVSKIRIVSVGFILKRISPDLTSSGMINIRSYGVEDGLQLVNTVGNTYSASQVRNVPLHDLHDEHVILEHSSQMPQVFYTPGTINPNNNLASWVAPGFTPSTVLGTGLPVSTACIHVEYVMHIELAFEDSTPLGLAATPAPPSNPIYRSIASAVTAQSDIFISQGKAAISTMIRRKVGQLLMGALRKSPYGAAAVGGGQLLLGNSMSVD